MSSVFNRTGVIALVVVGAVVAWGALQKDDPDPSSKAAAHAAERHSQRSGIKDAGADGS